VVGAVVYLTQLFYASDTARGLGGGIFPMASYKIIRRIAAIRVDAIHHPAKWRIPPLVVSLRDCAALLSDLTPGVWADGQAGPSNATAFGFRNFWIIGHGNPRCVITPFSLPTKLPIYSVTARSTSPVSALNDRLGDDR
jgi:hypothetical protein